MQNRIKIIFVAIFFISTKLASENIQIIYTHNTNGQFKSCQCLHGGYNGFISQRAFVIRELQSKYKNTLLIDGGDIFGVMAEEKENGHMTEAYSYIQYDIILPGENDLFIETHFQRLFMHSLQNKGRPRLLSGNLYYPLEKFPMNYQHRGVRSVKKNLGGITIRIDAYLQEDLYSSMKKLKFLPRYAWQTAYKKDNPAEFIILVIHADYKFASAFLKKINPKPGLVLLAHEPVWKKKLTKIQGIPILTLGKDGGRIGQIIISSKKKKIIKYRHIKITPDLKRNPFIQNLEKRLGFK
jgi:2',3'-cyclic-nucleotide 2'-phosphodiesterase (5'-nucleotidase family)